MNGRGKGKGNNEYEDVAGVAEHTSLGEKIGLLAGAVVDRIKEKAADIAAAITTEAKIANNNLKAQNQYEGVFFSKAMHYDLKSEVSRKYGLLAMTLQNEIAALQVQQAVEGETPNLAEALKLKTTQLQKLQACTAEEYKDLKTNGIYGSFGSTPRAQR